MGVNNMSSSNDLRDTSGNQPTDAAHRISAADVVLAATSLLLTGGLLAAVLRTQAGFSKIFADFAMKLPTLTLLVSSPGFTWLVGVLFVTTVLKELLLRNVTARTIWNACAILAVQVLAALYVIGIFGPLIVLVDRVAK
jgi:hypothetical protein